MNTPRRLRRNWPAIASSLALASLIPSAGCVGVVCMGGCEGAWQTYDETRSTSVPVAQSAPLHVKTRNGSIRISKTDGAVMKVTTTIRASTPERLAAFIIDITEETDGTLSLHPTPPEDTWQNNEGVSFEIALPGTTRIQADTSNGAIEITDLAGPATLDTSNGSITITNHTGDVKALTSNGRIEATHLAGVIHGDTSNGSIRVDLTDEIAGPVTLDTSNGGITLTTGPAFAGTVNIDTSNGRVTVEAPGDASVRQGRSDATVKLAREGGTSILDTSNGSVTFRVRGGGSAASQNVEKR